MSSRRDWVRYRFDVWMSKGTIALIGLLALASFVFVTVVAVIVWALPLHPEDEPEASFLDLFWGNLMRTLDPGTMGADRGWGFRIAMLVVTLGGLIIVASLIGIVSSGFDAKLDELRKGRSRVLESDHTLILGWSDKVYSIIRELAIANASRRRSVIVVLAPYDKVQMEDDIRTHVGDTGKTVVVCRSGDPMSLADLGIGSPDAARSIILVSDESEPDPDATVIKTALAVTRSIERPETGFHIVGELRHRSNLEAARLVGGDEVDWVIASELISRLIVQTCRQSGLSAVFAHLLSFEGSEVYITRQPELAGLDYAQLVLSFSDASVIGILREGTPVLNPPSTEVLRPDDEVIVIAEDDSLITVERYDAIDRIHDVRDRETAAGPDRTVILGAGPGLATILGQLDEYVVAGSSVLVVADGELPELGGLAQLAVEFRQGDPRSRRVLESLDLASANHVVVLADPALGAQRADSHTLITLLHLREIARQSGVTLNIVSEMLDDRNRELAEVTDADDFIVSDQVVALALAQLSEDERLGAVLRTLMSAEGSEIYLRPASDYLEPGVETDFVSIVAAARLRGESAIGYRVGALSRQSAHGYGVVLNPAKRSARTFLPEDSIIVLADD